MTISAIEGDFEIELEIEGHAATARATHRPSTRVYDFKITPLFVAGVSPVQPADNLEWLAARDAVMSAARKNGMMVTADPATFGFGEVALGEAGPPQTSLTWPTAGTPEVVNRTGFSGGSNP